MPTRRAFSSPGLLLAVMAAVGAATLLLTAEPVHAPEATRPAVQNFARLATVPPVGGRDWCSASLHPGMMLPEGSDLHHVEWPDVYLPRVRCPGCDLRRANLCGASFPRAALPGADFREADLSGATLQEANLREAVLAWATLHDVDLRGADLTEADLIGAELRSANLNGATLKGADLGASDLRGADLEEAFAASYRGGASSGRTFRTFGAPATTASRAGRRGSGRRSTGRGGWSEHHDRAG